MLKKIVVAIALVVAPSALHAQDFSGARIEGRVAWDQADLVLNFDEDQESEYELDFDLGSGVSYGLEAGYDAALGQGVIVGAYAGIEWSSIEHCEDLDAEWMGAAGEADDCVEAGRNITAGARLGYAFSSKAMAYLKGGYSNGSLKTTYEGPLGDDFSESGSKGGYHLGAGAEFNLSTNIYARIDYTYTDYGTIIYYEEDELVGSANMNRNQVSVGLGFRF